MRALIRYSLFFGGFIFSVHALNCRSDGGPKEEELKSIYMNCLKSQNGRNSSNNRGYSDDFNNSREKRKQNQRSRWDHRVDGFGNRDEAFGARDDWSNGDWTRNRDRISGRDSWSNRDYSTSNRDDSMSNRDNSMSNNNNRMGNSRDRMNNKDSHVNSRDDYMENDDYENQESQRYSSNGYKSSTQASRRNKRERTSGHRSQYNPNTSQRPSGYEDSYRTNERNSTENTSKHGDNKKACALHCFLDEMEMTGDNGMPDRYLVTQVITKDVRNEDLRDFLQESIEECFQMLYNENTQDKCEFSKNLMMCLSEKGRANCDDWKDNIKY